VSEEKKRYQFYGRRSGKTLRRHHLQLMEELLPELRVDLNNPLPAGEVRLEIGFGGGEHLVHQAALFPDVNFVGAEPFRNGVAKLLALNADGTATPGTLYMRSTNRAQYAVRVLGSTGRIRVLRFDAALRRWTDVL